MKKLSLILIVLLVPFVSSCHSWDDALQLYCAAVSGDTDVVRGILGQGVDANSKTPRGFTALQAAISNNNLEMVKLLVNSGADITMSCSEKEYTPLHVAAECGHDEIVSYLLNLDVDIDATTNIGKTPLILAVEENHHRVVELLLTWQAQSESVLDPELRELLPPDTRRLDIEHADRRGATALHHAVERENFEIAAMLIQYGALVNCTDRQGDTPLHIAASCCGVPSLQMLKLLKENGAQVNMRNIMGETPLMCALPDHTSCAMPARKCECSPDYNYISIVTYLLDNGADPNIVSTEKSPLHSVVLNNSCVFAHLLIKAGADVNQADNEARTPLHNAADRGHLEMVQLLLKSGADLYATDSNGNTPFDVAHTKDHEEIAREFIIHGFDILGLQLPGLEELQHATPELQGKIPQALRKAVDEHAVPMELQQMVLSYLSPTVWRSVEEC